MGLRGERCGERIQNNLRELLNEIRGNDIPKLVLQDIKRQAEGKGGFLKLREEEGERIVKKGQAANISSAKTSYIGGRHEI